MTLNGYVECHYAVSPIESITTNVIILSVIMLNFMVPCQGLTIVISARPEAKKNVNC